MQLLIRFLITFKSKKSNYLKFQNQGKKVTFNFTIDIEVQKVNSPSKNYLKLHDLLFMKKELSDVKLLCEGKTFDCQCNLRVPEDAADRVCRFSGRGIGGIDR